MSFSKVNKVNVSKVGSLVYATLHMNITVNSYVHITIATSLGWAILEITGDDYHVFELCDAVPLLAKTAATERNLGPCPEIPSPTLFAR